MILFDIIKKKKFFFLKDIPVPRRNRPLYSQHLSSAIICFVGGTRREIHVNDFYRFYKSYIDLISRQNLVILFIILVDRLEKIMVIK